MITASQWRGFIERKGSIIDNNLEKLMSAIWRQVNNILEYEQLFRLIIQLNALYQTSF